MDAFNAGSAGGRGGGFKYKSDVAEKSASYGSRCSLRPKPEPEHVDLQALPEPYTTVPGCQLTTDQDVKILEIALAYKTETPPHVASMNKTDANLQGSCVYIPLKLVRDHFIEEKTTATIQLEAPDKIVYSVGARKLIDDRVVIEAEWNGFVASLRIQESDALIFRSKANSRLQIVDPPPHEVLHMSSSDDDDDMPRRSSRLQKRVTRSCAETQSSCVKTRKMAPTSSPCANSGCGAPDRAPVRLEAVSETPSNNLRGSFRRRYIKTNRTDLTLQMEKEVKEKVQEIGSELPIFVGVMTSSNVDHARSEIAICKEYATVACLPDKTQPIVLQLEGKAEPFVATLSVNMKSRRRIILRNFARENQLKAGDICLFQLMAGGDTGKLMMTVHLIRKT
ncbi:unnamed protein product [Alopecurus aequalis]